jgi:very-short-patch-repair endonuclease
VWGGEGADEVLEESRLKQVGLAMTEWRNQLINVDGNNRLLYYRMLSAGTLSLAEANPLALEQLRRDQTIRLGKLFPEPETLGVALKNAKKIATNARIAEEEFGVSTAYMAVGMATWNDGRSSLRDSDDAGGADASMDLRKPRSTIKPSAPVLLQPVQFEARPGSRDAFELRLLGEISINPVLLHYFSSVFDVVIDDATVLESASDDETIFKAIEVECAGIEGFAIEYRSLIGTFSYMKQPMVEDLSDANVDFMANNEMVAAIAGVEEAKQAIRQQGGEVSLTAPDVIAPSEEFLVLDADASQSYAINRASAGQSIVVEGPPGTGKSQSIANLVADLVAKGNAVLFVAQKRAAITAVLQRLERVGLDHLAIDMFDGAGSRKLVVSKLAEALESMREARSVSTDELQLRWSTARDHLVNYQAALFETRFPGTISICDLLVMQHGVPKVGHSTLRLKPSTLQDWSGTTLNEMARVSAELSATGAFDVGFVGRQGWGIDSFSNLEELDDAYQFCLKVTQGTLPDAVAAIASLRDSSDKFGKQTVGVLRALLRDTSKMLRNSHDAFSPNLASAALQDAIDLNGTKEWRALRGVKMTWGERRAAKRTTELLLGRVTDKSARHEILLEVQRLRAAWLEAGAPLAVHAMPQATVDADDKVRSLVLDVVHIEEKTVGFNFTSMTLGELTCALESMIKDTYRLRLPRMSVLRAQMSRAGLGEVVVEMSAQGLKPEIAAFRIRYVFAMSLLEHFMSKDKRLAGVTGSQLDRWAMEFAEADEEHLHTNAARVRRLAAERMRDELKRFDSQYEALKKQIKRKRGFASVRQLFVEAPDALKAVKPCWAMSPLMVSQMLPVADLFDVVIFDEASQVLPADAIPAIARGRQHVIAGDSKQLPPTKDFQKLISVNMSEDEDDEDETRDFTFVAPLARDVESILDVATLALGAQRSQMLEWHYRSKDEKLITTNNRYVYQNRLTTFPGADGVDRIHFEAVPFSKGMGKNNKSPEAEVNRVVDLAIDHALVHPDESLGIIAFGSDHMRRIEAALDQRLKQERELQHFFQQSGLEPFFIKNIERVQGDEREAIILSVGYGKGDDGRLRYTWGPLLEVGGERRLNVATSRARSRMTLVASFGPDDINPTASSAAGFQLMYRFIQFMASNGQNFGDNPGRDVKLNAFEAAVFEQLQSKGLQLEPQWGVGGYFLDFAVRDPDLPGRFVLAIECDGAQHHSSSTARERDRLRQQQLERLGWTFHRIWSTDWFHDPTQQIEDTVQAYEAALAMSRSRVASPKMTVAPLQSVTFPGSVVSERSNRPQVTPGFSISQYSAGQLASIVRWILSDDVVRTHDEILETAMNELGFQRRGPRIVAALNVAIARVLS